MLTLMKKILLILGLICSVVTYIHIDNKVTRYELPSGRIKWTHTRPKDAKMCIPAAFTGEDGKISGSYIYIMGKLIRMVRL